MSVITSWNTDDWNSFDMTVCKYSQHFLEYMGCRTIYWNTNIVRSPYTGDLSRFLDVKLKDYSEDIELISELKTMILKENNFVLMNWRIRLE